jgi:hypothetical protein
MVGWLCNPAGLRRRDKVAKRRSNAAATFKRYPLHGYHYSSCDAFLETRPTIFRHGASVFDKGKLYPLQHLAAGYDMSAATLIPRHVKLTQVERAVWDLECFLDSEKTVEEVDAHGGRTDDNLWRVTRRAREHYTKGTIRRDADPSRALFG